MKSSPFHALAHYRLLPQTIPLTALLIAAVSRIPYAMIPLGTMATITAGAGSIATGATTTAIVSLCAATISPIHGRIADIISPRMLLLILWPLSSLATASLFIGAIYHWSNWRLWACAAFTGLTMIPVGAFTRARWVTSTDNPKTLGTAFSYESMTDELMFVIGPALVGLSSAVLWWAPLALSALLICVFVGLFALSTPPSSPKDPSASLAQTDLPHPPIVTVLVQIWPTIGIMVGVGMLFGATQAGITARALTQGAPGQAGLWYALMGIGSAFIALMVVLIPERISTAARIGFPSLAASAILLGTSFVHSLAHTGFLLIFSGLGVGIVLVTTFAAAESLAPQGGLTVAMTAMPAAITIGVSLGSFLGGYTSSYWSDSAAFAVASSAGLIAATCSLALFLRSKKNTIPMK